MRARPGDVIVDAGSRSDRHLATFVDTFRLRVAWQIVTTPVAGQAAAATRLLVSAHSET
jgi:hypothetical protein